MKTVTGKMIAPRGLRVGIVVSRFSREVTERLLDGALDALADAKVAKRAVTVVWVPGAVELGMAAGKLASLNRFDALITLGCVIRGETDHFTYVCKAAQEGVARVALDSGLPVTFGVLTTETAEQAFERAGGAHGNKGYEAAMAAVEMATLYRSLE